MSEQGIWNYENFEEAFLGAGYDWFNVKYNDGEYEICVALNTWWTPNLAQSVPLPTGKGKTFHEAVNNLVLDCNK